MVVTPEILARIQSLQAPASTPASTPARPPALADALASIQRVNPPTLTDAMANVRRVRAEPSESHRVVQLPRADYYNRRDLTELLKAPGGTMELRSIQSAALHAVRDAQGAVLPIGVGWGKTLIGLLAGRVLSLSADEWGSYTGNPVAECAPVDRCLYLTAAGAVNQTRRAVLEMAAHWQLPETIIVRSYSELSQPSASSALSEWILGTGRLTPPSRALVVLDEAHKLKRPEAARTKRFLRAWEELDGVRYVVASGTLINRSLKDGATLAAVALRGRSPLPRTRAHLTAWCDWIDDDQIPNAMSWRILWPLIQAFGPPPGLHTHQARARLAFGARLRSCPGVVASEEGALGVSLRIRKLHHPRPPASVAEAQRMLSNRGERPDGEVMEDDLAETRVRKQLSCGFWYRWDWGEDGPDLEWMEARREWHRLLRSELRNHSAEGYDSPLLVGGVLSRKDAEGARTGELGAARRAWLREQERRPDLPPPTRAVWVSDYLMQDAAEWLRDRPGALLWYESRAVADRLEELGVKVVRAGEDPPLDGNEPLALSVRSHGTGLDLQRWSSSRILECPSSGMAWEQMLGRTHRPGQQAEEVEAEVYIHTASMRDAWVNANRNAQMIEQATGNRQKLCYADLD